MIGIMNVGSDSSVEFYASARQSSLYARKPSKDSRTYTPEGRVLINGIPEVQDTPEDLWRSLIFKAVTTRVVKEVEAKEPSGPLAIIRRFSSKFGFRQSQNTEQPTQSENAEASKDNRKSSDDQKHVTIIRVKTVQNKDNKAAIEDGTLDDELHIYAQESILKRLMEEKAMIEKQVGDVSMEWATDSGRASLDDEHDIVVERF